MDTSNKLLVSVEVAAQMIDVSRSNLYKLIAEGKIHPLKIGRSTKFSTGELKRFINDLESECFANQSFAVSV